MEEPIILIITADEGDDDDDMGKTVLEVLENRGYKVEGKEYPEIGMFVTNIVGQPLTPEGSSWSFKLDNVFITVGVSTQKVKKGQVLECRIIPWDEFPDGEPEEEV